MKIVAVVEKTIPIRTEVRNARVSFDQIAATVLAVVTDQKREGRPVVGYSFNSFGRYACGGPLRDRFIRRLLDLDSAQYLDANGVVDPDRVQALLLRPEKAGGHAERSMSLGTLDLALWDIVGKMARKPLAEVIRERYRPQGPRVERIPCYAGGGFYREGAGVDALASELHGYLEAGYTRAKIKVGGPSLRFDIDRIEAAIRVLGSGSRLALDASCSFDRSSALDFVREVNPYGLWWLEEPCEPEDFETYRAVSEAHAGLTAGGENVFSEIELKNFVRHGPLPDRTILQPDPPLAYGVGALARMVQIATESGVRREHIMPHGGNMMSLHVAAGLDLGSAESYPGLFGEFGGFSDEVRLAGGFATLPSSPGVGFEQQPALFSILRGLGT